MGEADLLEIGRVARSTWQNWVRQGLLEQPSEGVYDEQTVIELSVVALFATALDLRQTKGFWRPAREVVLHECLLLPLDAASDLEAIVDLHTWELRIARGADALLEAICIRVAAARGFMVFPLAPTVVEARTAYWRRAVPARELASDKRRRARSAARAARRSPG